jgi:gamma-glutamylcyclotransferase (GGCT)/AIG2-like uncharacterized protein YtfP
MILADFLAEAGEVPVYYFAYGMLTDPEIMDGIELVGVAKLPNFRYEMLEYADVVPTPGSVVYGCLWKVDRRIIANLDRVEGYPTLYDRKTVPAYVNGEKYAAELYTMTPATREELAGTMPKQSYVNKIIRGYNHAGVPLEQVKHALRLAHKNKAETVDEVAMNPKAFAASLEQAKTQGVLVGFEFEVLVPEATIGGGEVKPEVNKFTPENIQKIFSENDIFDRIEFDEVSVEKFDSVFKLKPEFTEAKFPTATEALKAYKLVALENAKKIFDQIPPEVRAKYIKKVGPNNYKKTIDGQLDFAYRLGTMIYLNSRGKLETQGAELRRATNVDYSKLLPFWLGQRSYWVDSHLNSIFSYDPEQAYNLFDLDNYEEDDDWDDYDDYHDYDYNGAVKVLEPAVKQAFGRKVRVFDEYHEENKNLKDWYIEPDGSLGPTNERDGAAEIVSPPLPAGEAMTALKNFYAMASQLNLYTNKSTGLHINISIPQELDVLKLAVFLGDRYVLQQFGRENNSYSKSAEKAIQQKAPGKLTRQGKIDYTKLQKIAQEATGFHTASISNSGKYISFRHAGGDYLADYAKIADTVGRFIRAMVIAADPNAYAQEYKTKLAKLTQRPSAETSPADYLRTTGVPALTAYVWPEGRAITNQLVNYIKSGVDDQPFISRDLEQSSVEAKQAIVNTLRDNKIKERAMQAPDGQFYKLTLIPGNIKAIAAARDYNERGVQLLAFRNNAYVLIRTQTLPPTDPAVQALLKSALQAKYKK